MPTVAQTPVNVISGVTSSIVPPGYGDIGNAVQRVVIYNSTGTVLLVQYQGGSAFLQPLMADVFPCSSLVQAPTVTPSTAAAAGTYLGTITSMFYFAGDPPPTGFPISLQQFPGGSYLVASFPNSNRTVTITAGGGITAANNPATLTVNLAPFIIQPPAGTGVITFTGELTFVETGGATYSSLTAQLVGIQTGTVYGPVTISSIGTNLQTVKTFSIDLFDAQDTSFEIQITAVGFNNTGTIVVTTPNDSGVANFFAAPGGPTPEFATKFVEVQATTAGATILAAPTTGAWYLFSAEVVGNSGATFVVLSSGAGNFAFITASTSQIRPYELFKLRVTSPVVGTTDAGTAFVILLYAPGP